jgi:hypothetical protein
MSRPGVEHHPPASAGDPVRDAAPGDWLEVAGLPGRPPRRGQVVEVLGRPGHEHFRVRWDEAHESVFFPTEATRIVKHGRPARLRSGR